MGGVRSGLVGMDADAHPDGGSDLLLEAFGDGDAPGVLGNQASAQQESFTAALKVAGVGPDSTCASGGLLDYPHYTRPAEFRGMAAPDVLMGGNHEQIRKWRRRKALEKTLRNRPDLLQKQPLSEEDRRLLEEMKKAISK